MEPIALLIAASLNAGTVLAIASLGLLINEKAGIVNLGAEGMMLCSALAGFAAVVYTGSGLAGFVAGMAVGPIGRHCGGCRLQYPFGVCGPVVGCSPVRRCRCRCRCANAARSHVKPGCG